MWFTEVLDRLKNEPEQPVFRPEVEVWTGEIPDPAVIHAALKSSHRADPRLRRMCEDEREKVRIAEMVLLEGGPGIGDWVMSMRYAIMLAEALPDKKVKLLLHGALRACPYLHIPTNCIVADELKPTEGENVPKTMINLFSHSRVYKMVEEVLEDHPTYARHDAIDMAYLQELELPVRRKDAERSILDLPESLFKEFPVEFDYMFAPDAKEAETNDGKRSLKSLSLSQWDTVFSRVPPGSRIAILLGNAHEDYCERVYKLAKKYGGRSRFKVERIETATLGNVVEQVLRAKTFVGMDSGTTHLAYEVMVAAKEAGREIQLKEIFNRRRFDPSQYALRGLPSQVSVLLEKEEETQAYGHEADLSNIYPQDVVDFIFGKDLKAHTSAWVFQEKEKRD